LILAHIVAAAQNDVIGMNNDLPWKIPEDAKFFRDKTKGKALIMGRKTFESVGHPLPNRLSVVVTRQKDYALANPAAGAAGASGKGSTAVVVQPDLKSAIEYCRTQIPHYGEEIFIIGGGEIYRESISLVDKIYLTRIHTDFKGDTTYPKVNLTAFELVEQKDRTEPVPFSFLTYVRKR
jgi:dihydrofolate reductase